MANKTIAFITRNEYKARSMQARLAPFDITVELVGIDTPEIQAPNCAAVAAFSAEWAAQELGRPVIKADAGLFIAALNGLPGIYTSQFQKQLGAEKVLRLLDDAADRAAHLEYAIAYCEPGEKALVFASGSKGSIAQTPQGDDGMLVDFVFMPEGETRTMGELKQLAPDKRAAAWGDAEEQFGAWFTNH